MPRLVNAVTPVPEPARSGSVLAGGVLVSEDGGRRPAHWTLAEEVAVGFSYEGRTGAVMMATPADLKDFAYGFTLSEELVDGADAIRAVLAEPVEGGMRLEISVAPGRFDGERLRSRGVAGRSGCGLCGVERIADAVRRPPRVRRDFDPAPAAVRMALDRLPALQVMNSSNHSLHAAAACAPSGEVLAVREDIGRHNALDKLIGAMARAGIAPAGTFVVLTSRCSFEMVQKAAATGIPHLVSISAPTGLALHLVREAGMTLVALGGRGELMLFDGATGADGWTRPT